MPALYSGDSGFQDQIPLFAESLPRTMAKDGARISFERMDPIKPAIPPAILWGVYSVSIFLHTANRSDSCVCGFEHLEIWRSGSSSTCIKNPIWKKLVFKIGLFQKMLEIFCV
jgi:hypothetical protein